MNIRRYNLYLIQFSLQFVRHPSPILPHCLTVTEPYTPRRSAEVWTTLVVVGVDVVTSALQTPSTGSALLCWWLQLWRCQVSYPSVNDNITMMKLYVNAESKNILSPLQIYCKV